MSGQDAEKNRQTNFWPGASIRGKRARQKNLREKKKTHGSVWDTEQREKKEKGVKLPKVPGRTNTEVYQIWK